MRPSGIAIGAVILAAVLRAQIAEAGDARPYSGDFLKRSTLTGDWGVARNDLAIKGITFDASLTQVEQGVGAGGKSGSWEYGGRGNLTGKVDTEKLGLWPGGFLTVEIEGNWSDSVNVKTGALNPVNTNQLFPLPGGDNVALPNLSFAQFLSPYVGVNVGKLDTLGGDDNAFAHGKGDTQFFNLAFNINPVVLVVPYSTLGTGVIALPTKDPKEAIVSFAVLSANGKASTDGFDDIHGAIFSGEGRVRTRFADLTGHQLVGAVYSNKEYTSIDQRVEVEPVQRLRLPLAKKDGTWAVFYNFDQLLWETDRSAGNGIGLFGRFGASAGNPNPTEYFYSIGFGGKGVVASRDLDRFGIGYYYDSVKNPTLQNRLLTRSFLRDEWGFEAFYNVALTPWFLLTPDIQVVGPSQKRRVVVNYGSFSVTRETLGTAIVLGVRVQLVL